MKNITSYISESFYKNIGADAKNADEINFKFIYGWLYISPVSRIESKSKSVYKKLLKAISGMHNGTRIICPQDGRAVTYIKGTDDKWWVSNPSDQIQSISVLYAMSDCIYRYKTIPILRLN